MVGTSLWTPLKSMLVPFHLIGLHTCDGGSVNSGGTGNFTLLGGLADGGAALARLEGGETQGAFRIHHGAACLGTARAAEPPGDPEADPDASMDGSTAQPPRDGVLVTGDCTARSTVESGGPRSQKHDRTSRYSQRAPPRGAGPAVDPGSREQKEEREDERSHRFQ